MNTINITPKERYQLSKKGVPADEVKKFMHKFQLGQKQMATLLSVSDKTLYTQLKEKRIDHHLSDRFLLVQSVFAEGEETLMSVENFRQWLDLPHRNFDGQTPMTLLSTINGAEAVRSELIRTKYGVLS